MEGIITFNGFKLDKMNYERSQNNGQDDMNLSPKFMIYRIQSEENSSDFNIVLGIKIGEEDSELPFEAEVIVRGFFTFTSDEITDYEIEDIQRFTLINGSAILFPYLRSILTDITSKSNHNPVILPTINFTKFIQSKDLDEMLIDSEFYEDIE
ncbi:protein-export chaperone SecB [Bacillus licheniformis]|uniref:protein-export chaperone SecB n=1 Tax=Bacillus licheniformis TaxID=1402 RepID=UPI0030C96B5F